MGFVYRILSYITIFIGRFSLFDKKDYLFNSLSTVYSEDSIAFIFYFLVSFFSFPTSNKK
jgi:hypothetical protein